MVYLVLSGNKIGIVGIKKEYFGKFTWEHLGFKSFSSNQDIKEKAEGVLGGVVFYIYQALMEIHLGKKKCQYHKHHWWQAGQWPG